MQTWPTHRGHLSVFHTTEFASNTVASIKLQLKGYETHRNHNIMCGKYGNKRVYIKGMLTGCMCKLDSCESREIWERNMFERTLLEKGECKSMIDLLCTN